MLTDIKRPRSFGEPLHVFTSPFPYSGSPSPTRAGKVPILIDLFLFLKIAQQVMYRNVIPKNITVAIYLPFLD